MSATTTSSRPKRRPLPPHILAAMAAAFSLLGDMFLYAVLPSHYGELGLTRKQVGVLLSANRVVRFGSNPFAGAMADRYGVSGPFVLAMLVGACATAVYGLTNTFLILLAARVSWGVCWSFIRLGYLQTAVRHARSARLGAAMGFVGGIARAGAFAGAVLGGVLSDTVGFRGTAFILAAISSVAIVLAWLSQRRHPDRGAIPAAPANSSTPRDAPPPHRAKGTLALMTGGFAVGLVGGGIVLSTLGSMLLERFGDRVTVFGISCGVASLTGAILGLRWCVDTVLAPVAGMVSDRWGRRRVAGFAFVVGGLMLLASELALPPVVLVAGVCCFFFSVTTAGVSLHAEASLAVPPANRNRYLSQFVTACDVGSAAGPLLAWIAMDGVRLGPLTIPPVPLQAIYSAGALVCGVAALAMLWRPRGRGV
ncbi:MAG: MFS transporter [bacterium]|nr:MFS transporter [bacterium]